MDGIINLLKPAGMTSHDLVRIIRKKFNGVKTGHTGTLDPMAVGVLPICVGKATRITEYLDLDFKKYRCELQLGIETDTQDIWGNVLTSSDVNVSNEEIREAISSFEGDILQTPPEYSAVRVNGRRLYEYARQGEKVEIKSRKIHIKEIRIIDIYDNNKVMFDVICSKGTYIRTLCSDIGKKLGCGGTMSFLLRTETGRFKIEDTLTIEELEDFDMDKHLFPIDYPLEILGRIELQNQKQYEMALNGVMLNPRNVTMEEGHYKELYRVYYQGIFLAVAMLDEETGRVKMNKVFARGVENDHI